MHDIRNSTLSTLNATITATTILTAITPSLVDPSQTFHIYYGTASSAANYGCTVATPTRKLLLSTSMMSLMGGKNVRSPKLKRVPTELIIVSSTIQKRELKRST
jgi:hypothetical protein